MKYFSLFSGIGGFELGIKQAYIHRNSGGSQTSQPTPPISCLETRQPSMGGLGDNASGDSRPSPICVGFSEIDKYAIQIYKKHFPNHKEYGDVTNISWPDVPDFELLCGGFPCQSFSIAGKRGGFSDTRGTLFFEIARATQEKHPRLLLLENVKGLLSHDKGRTFGIILNTLDELGYDLQWQVLNSKNFGVPQNRERIFIIGHLRITPRPQVFPLLRSSKKSVGQDAQRNDIAHTITDTDKYRGSYIKGDILQGVSNTRPHIRRLTPTECERLQGFPDNWTSSISDTQRYKCLGNAVTTNVISAIMKKTLDSLRRICYNRARKEPK